MAVKLSPIGNSQIIDANGNPAVGWTITTYAAGSSTPLATYTDATGSTAQSASITLNALGLPEVGQIWLTVGLAYKFIVKNAGGVSQFTIDNISGVNDASTSTSQWTASGVTPTYISASSFALVGDQTSEFHVGRRLQFTTTAGTVYGTISVSADTTLTTITMIMDSGQVLDSGLSAVNLSILRADRPALPNSAAARAVLGVSFRSHLAGLTMSTAGSSTTMTIAAGEAADSTNVQVMQLATAISKTTSAWAVGTAAGGLDTGSIANSTWYHFYEIKRVDTGVVDVVFGLSASAPTLPANYTLYRRIGSGLTNGSGQWTAFIQDGDYSQWVTPPADVAATNPGILAVPRTLSVPTGINVVSHIQYAGANSGTGGSALMFFSDLATADVVPSSSNTDTASLIGNTGGVTTSGGSKLVRTNTSAQIRSRAAYSDANVVMNIKTLGWFDRRGRDA